MANRKLLKKVAPVVMSAAVAFSSMPATAFASDFADSDVAVVEEDSEETEIQTEDTEEPEDITDVTVEEDSEEEEDSAETEDAAVVEDSEEEFTDAVGEETSAYVLMNIPYNEFYKAELKNNDVKVDAFTSATLNKSRTGGKMAGGSYHVNSDGSDITGVTFPVKVSDISVLKDQKQVTEDSSVTIKVTNRGTTSETTYKGKDALFESATYSYYVLAAEPDYYKELTVNADGSYSFGAVTGKKADATVVNTTADLSTETTYGDYQLNIDETAFKQAIDVENDTIYGATVNTTDGTNYGLRHLENIWLGNKLAWCTGFTKAVHNCPTSSEHYKSMMGKTIDSVTYYTSKGIVKFDLEDIKVPVKTGVTVTAAAIHTTDKEIPVTLSGNLPEDFSAKYFVDDTEASYADGKVTVAATLSAGTHTLKIKDANEKYAAIETSFDAKDAELPVVYDTTVNQIVAAKDVTAEKFADYVKSITSVTVGDKSYAASGRGSKVIVKEDGTLDTASLGLTEDTEFTVKSNKYDDLKFTYSIYTYVYAGVNWSQYWAAENVYNAGDATSVEEKDSHNETDKGGFDTVTRATFNHGVHRGSFQCMATVYTENGNQYQLSYWKNGSTPVLVGGTEAKWTGANRDTGEPAKINVGNGDESINHYTVTGLKYVPVRVASADYAAFAKAYPVVKNGETLVGGYSEQNLKAYTETANVTANTNGLKVATKNEDGSFSFGTRQAGSESGIKDQALKVAEGTTVTVKDATGSYGEFLRVDITGNYGDLGAALQATTWQYYGNGDTVLATYGTKFAADNWMHKSMGIQLGLTDSVRCKLPEGTDGTGRWKVTVYALGYQDYSFEFDATYDNVVVPTDPSTLDTTPLTAALEKVKALKQSDYTPETWAILQAEADEVQDMLDDIAKAIKDGTMVNFSQAAIKEQVEGHLENAISGLKDAVLTLSKTTGTLTVGGTEKLTVTTNLSGNATWKSSNEKVATVKDGVVTAKAAGTATITASINGKTATYTVTVKAAPAPTQKPVVKTTGITAKVAQVYVGKKATVQVTKENVTGTAKFKSSNKKVATVNAKGVVTGKKAGKAKITVTVGKYTKVLNITVKKPSFKLAKASASIKKGKKTTIKVKAAPVSKVTYKSSNKSVATVTKKGVVTGKKKGTAKITVKCNGITRTFKVTVK